MSPDPGGDMRQWGNHEKTQRQGHRVSSQALGRQPPAPLSSEEAVEVASCDLPVDDRPVGL